MLTHHLDETLSLDRLQASAPPPQNFRNCVGDCHNGKPDAGRDSLQGASCASLCLVVVLGP